VCSFQRAVKVDMFEPGRPVYERLAIRLAGFLACAQFPSGLCVDELDPTAPRMVRALFAKYSDSVLAPIFETERVRMFVNPFSHCCLPDISLRNMCASALPEPGKRGEATEKKVSTERRR